MLNLSTKHNDPNASLGWTERIGYGSANLGMNMISAIFGSFLTIYFTNVALLDAAVISSIIAVSKLFDGISDLVIGGMVDRTKSKYGKARVWLMRMCIPFAISVLLLFWVPENFPTMAKYVYVFLMYNIANTICYTAMLVPYYSLISLITKNPYERGFLGNCQQIFSTAGNVIVNSVFVYLLTKFSSSAENIYTQKAFTMTMLLFCIIMVVLSFLAVFCTKERLTDVENPGAKQETEKINPLVAAKALLTNKYWVMLTVAMFVIFFVIIFYAVGAVFYAQYVFVDMAQYSWMANSISIAQFAIMFATPVLMKKFNKTQVYVAGIAVMSLGFLGFGLFASTKSVMLICNALKGIGLGMSGGMALGMVADTITYGTLKSGIDAVGMGNAGVSAAQKLGMGLGTAVFGWILDGAGFDGSLPAEMQPASVATAIKFVYNYIPLAMCVVVLLMFLFFYHIERDLKKMQEN